MSQARVDAIVKRLRELPSLPTVLLEVNRVMNSPAVTVDEVRDIISRDPSITSKILRMANSSYYGLSYRVDTLGKAITVLGFNTIRNLAVTASVYDIFEKKECKSIDIKGLWYHSLGCAIAGKGLICKMDPVLQEKVFICGILHDIGTIIISENLQDYMEEILDEIKQNKSLPQSNLEERLMGCNHGELGAFVAEKWNFPRELSDGIRFHHNIFSYLSIHRKEKLSPEAAIIVSAVYAGNQVAKAMGLGKSSDEYVCNINPLVWKYLNITKEDFPQILFKIKRNFDEVMRSWKL